MQNALDTARRDTPRLTWQAPEVKDLPRLTELTLQTGGAIPGECGVGGSGSTCF